MPNEGFPSPHNKDNHQTFFGSSVASSRNAKILAIVFIVVVLALIVDSMINQVSDFLVPQLTSIWGMISFIIIAFVSGIGQFLILEFIKHRTKDIRCKFLHIKILHGITTTVQYFLLAVITALILEMLLSSKYQTGILITVTIASYSLNIVTLGLLSKKLFSWYMTNRTSVVVILYAVSFTIAALTSLVAAYKWSLVLTGKQPEITPQTEVIFPSFEPNSLLQSLTGFYQYSSDISFALIWLATLVLLYHYRHREGRTKYWLIMGLPLVYYLSTSIDTIGFYIPKTESEEFFFYMYTSLNSTAGGVLFGLSFWVTSKNLPHGSIVKDYMIITGYGFVLFFISDQATLIAASYPPFGIATVSFYGLSAYLIFLGLYSTAISVAQDTKFRVFVRKLAKEHSSRLLDSIGSSEMEFEIQKKVLRLAKINSETMEREIGIKSALSENEVKEYLTEVINEIKSKQKP